MFKNIQNTLKKYNSKVWVMYNVDNLDKYFCKYVSNNLASQSILVISTKDIYLLVSSLDAENVDDKLKKIPNFHIIVYNSSKFLSEIIEEIIAKLKFPSEIMLSFSTMSDKATDILTHGDYINLTNILKRPYTKYNKKIRFKSAEKIIYEIESVKTDLQIERLKYIAKITDEILRETITTLKVGMSEIDIVDYTHLVTDKTMKKYIGKKQIKSYDYAWENNPIVLTGENLKKGGHSLPSDKKLKRGDTVYFDFGLKVTFDDEEVLFTDMQRMGYVLKYKETKPPKDVAMVFDTLILSIESGIEEMRSGTCGYVVDDVVRSIITKKYPDYNHATGHPVGLKVHDIGTLITLKLSKRARLELVENGVYTLEPRVQIPNGGSIEEMIQVTKFGGIPISPLQKEIYK